MRNLVICTDNFHKEYDSVVDYGSIEIYGESVFFSLIDSEDQQFDGEALPHSVLVKKKAFSCNYRDLALMKIASKRLQQLQRENPDDIKYYTIGSEFSGIVVNIGKNVTSVSIGDRVIGDNNYPKSLFNGIMPGIGTNHASSELEILHESKLITIPENMSFEVAAGFSIAGQTIYSMLEKLTIQPNTKVLFTGIKSNTSLLGLSHLKNKGVQLYGLIRKPIDRQKYNAFNLKDIFQLNDGDRLVDNQAIINHVNKFGKFDYVIDPFSDTNLIKLVDVIAVGGKYITCGISDQLSAKSVEINLNNVLAKIITNNITIYGNCLGTTEHLKTALFDYSNGNIDLTLDEIIEDDIQRFMKRTFNSPDRFGKVIFKYS